MNNVVSFERKKSISINKIPKNIDTTAIIQMVLDWAESNGVDATNDVAFQVRCADFMTYLELAARDEARNAISV